MRGGVQHKIFFSQHHNSPDDLDTNCVHYSTDDLLHFGACDHQYIREILPDGLLPFWTIPVENISSATNNVAHINVSRSIEDLLFDNLGKYA